ncbi:hypothetical protein [Arthrobacter sp. JSM 101049]|uniref:hypothetical protein n=1 Tax=Arthrobacter sp. JSM 101049 TaxID=929097 RepID=UPI0035676699
MAAPRKLPEARILLELRDRGMTLAGIAELYGVTESGVQRALARAEANAGRRTYRDILPWAIDVAHRSTAVMGHIRVLARLRSGLEVPERDLSALHAWLDWLEEHQLVLNYHPEAPPNPASRIGGFYYMQRRPGDEWIIRQPVTATTGDERP